MSKKSLILCALLFCGIAEAQPVTMRPAIAPPVRVAPRPPRFVRFTPMQGVPASPLSGAWRAPVAMPSGGGGYNGPVLRAPEGAPPQPRCFTAPAAGIATVTRSREVRLPVTPALSGPSAARDQVTTINAVTSGCPGGPACSHVRTVQRTVQGAGSTQKMSGAPTLRRNFKAWPGKS